jgi:hypothetical protein
MNLLVPVFKKKKFYESKNNVDFFLKYVGKMVGAGAEAEILYKLEPEVKFLTSWSQSLGPLKNGPAPQHCTGSNFCFFSIFVSTVPVPFMSILYYISAKKVQYKNCTGMIYDINTKT